MKKLYFFLENKLLNWVVKIVFACLSVASFFKKILKIVIDAIIILFVPVLVYLAIIAGDYYRNGQTKNFLISFAGIIIIFIIFVTYKICKTPKCA